MEGGVGEFGGRGEAPWGRSQSPAGTCKKERAGVDVVLGRIYVSDQGEIRRQLASAPRSEHLDLIQPIAITYLQHER